VANLTIGSGPDAFNTTINLGPFELTINQGRADITATMQLGTDARLGLQDLVAGSLDPSLLVSSLDAGANWNIDFPLVLSENIRDLTPPTLPSAPAES